MNRNNPNRQKTAGIIRFSCGILSFLFSFCYLYFLQGEILAEAQYVYSGGITTYNLLAGAIIIPIVLQVLQWIVSKLSKLPPCWHALSYLPSMLALAIITDVNRASIIAFSFGDWVWIAPAVILAYIIVAVIVKRANTGYGFKPHDVWSQAYPNYIILFVLILSVGCIPKSSDIYHFELKAERLVLDKDYEGAAEVGYKSLQTSARLTQLRMYALSKQGQLADRLFEYPQHYGSRGLLDINDSQPDYRFSSQDICLYLGALCGTSIKSTDRYYQLMLADSIWNQQTADYYLCSLLLDKRLDDFQQQLPNYYNLADSVPNAYDNLPLAFREAFLVIGQPEAAMQGSIVIADDTLATLSDTILVRRFREYNEMKTRLSDPLERINRTHRQFGKTFWWYYDYSDKATGELSNDKMTDNHLDKRHL